MIVYQRIVTCYAIMMNTENTLFAELGIYYFGNRNVDLNSILLTNSIVYLLARCLYCHLVVA